MLRDIPIAEDGLPVMSRSALEAADCDYRLLSLYHPDPSRRVSDDSDYSRRGDAYHKIKKCYVRRLAAAGTPMDFDESKVAFEEGIAEARCIPRIVPEVRDIWDRAVQHFELDLNAYHSTEERIVRLEPPVGWKGDRPFLPYILETDLNYAHADRNEFEIQDDKTYFTAFSEAHARALPQQKYYVWASMIEYPGFDSYRMTFSFVRLNQYVSVVYDKDDFEVLDREIRAMEASRRQRYNDARGSGAWPAVPGEVCGFCALNCPLYTNKEANTGLIRVNDKASFQTVAGTLVAFDKRRKMMIDALKRFVTTEGAQNVRGEVFSFRPTVTKLYDAGSVVDRIRAKGFVPNFTASSSTLRAMLKMIPGLKEDLASIVKTKEVARFGHRSEKATFAADAGEDEDE